MTNDQLLNLRAAVRSKTTEYCDTYEAYANAEILHHSSAECNRLHEVARQKHDEAARLEEQYASAYLDSITDALRKSELEDKLVRDVEHPETVGKLVIRKAGIVPWMISLQQYADGVATDEYKTIWYLVSGGTDQIEKRLREHFRAL